MHISYTYKYIYIKQPLKIKYVCKYIRETKMENGKWIQTFCRQQTFFEFFLSFILMYKICYVFKNIDIIKCYDITVFYEV